MHRNRMPPTAHLPPSSSASDSIFAPSMSCSDVRADEPPQDLPSACRYRGVPSGWSSRPFTPPLSLSRPPTPTPQTSPPAPRQPLPSFGQRTTAARMQLGQLRPGTSPAPGGPVSSMGGKSHIRRVVEVSTSRQEEDRVPVRYKAGQYSLQEKERASENNALKSSLKKEMSAAHAPLTGTMVQSNSKAVQNTTSDTDFCHSNTPINTSAIHPGGVHQYTVGHKYDHNMPRNRSASQCTKLYAGISFCGFCKKNGELASTFGSHSLRCYLPDGSTIVTCPILRSLQCDICGATGDTAHTRSHCPQGKQYKPVAVLLKSTARRCDGALRNLQRNQNYKYL